MPGLSGGNLKNKNCSLVWVSSDVSSDVSSISISINIKYQYQYQVSVSSIKYQYQYQYQYQVTYENRLCCQPAYGLWNVICDVL